SASRAGHAGHHLRGWQPRQWCLAPGRLESKAGQRSCQRFEPGKAMIRDQETLIMLLHSVARFVREQLVPIEEEVAETDQIPERVRSDMRELGLFGLTIPEEYGGLALTM